MGSFAVVGREGFPAPSLTAGTTSTGRAQGPTVLTMLVVGVLPFDAAKVRGCRALRQRSRAGA